MDTLADRGWEELKNGVLLERAETEGYQLLITADQNLRYQQNLASRRIAVLVLPAASWPSTCRMWMLSWQPLTKWRKGK